MFTSRAYGMGRVLSLAFGTDYHPFGTVLMISGHWRVGRVFINIMGQSKKRGHFFIKILGQYENNSGQPINFLGLTVIN